MKHNRIDQNKEVLRLNFKRQTIGEMFNENKTTTVNSIHLKIAML